MHKLLNSKRGIFVEPRDLIDGVFIYDLLRDNNWYYFKEAIHTWRFKDFDTIKSYRTKIKKSEYDKLNGVWVNFSDDDIEIIDDE